MASFGTALAGGAAGAAQGAQIAGPTGAAVLGGVDFLAGLLGGAPREDPLTRQNRQLQSNVAQQMYRYGTGVPGSDPGETAALAQDRGALGAAQRQQQQQLYGGWNPMQGTNGLADMMRNLANNQVGQQMSLQESHMINALSQRRQALMDAANVAGRAANTGPQYQPQSDLPQVLGQVAQMIAKQRAMSQGQGQGGVPGAPGGSSGGGAGSGVVLGGNGVPGYTPQYPGNFPQPQGGGLTPPGAPAAPDFLGALPNPLYLQGNATTQGVGPGSQPANAAAGQVAPPAAANAPFGSNTPANQVRQSGLYFGVPGMLQAGTGLRF